MISEKERPIRRRQPRILLVLELLMVCFFGVGVFVLVILVVCLFSYFFGVFCVWRQLPRSDGGQPRVEQEPIVMQCNNAMCQKKKQNGGFLFSLKLLRKRSLLKWKTLATWRIQMMCICGNIQVNTGYE